MNDNIGLFGDTLIDLIKDKKSFNFFPVCGGSIFNTALTLGRLGVKVDFYSYVGTDFWGDFIIDKMKKYNINTEYIKRDTNYKTSLAFCIIDNNGNASYDFYKYNKKIRINTTNIINNSFFFYGSLFSIIEENRDNLKEMLIKAKRNNILKMYDPNIRKNHLNSKKLEKNIYNNFNYADIIKCSIEDLSNIVNINKIEDGFDFLEKFNPILTIITAAQNGTFAKLRYGKIVNVSTIKVNNIVDTIGAGDNFSAGIIYFLKKKSLLTRERIISMSDNTLYNLLYFANSCARFSLKNRGAFIDDISISKLKNIFNSL